jgi:hypothetical protein
MGKLNYILEELLFESRRKDTIKKYEKVLTKTFMDNPIFVDGIETDSFEDILEWVEKELPNPKYLEYVLNLMDVGVYGLHPEEAVERIKDFDRLSKINIIKNKDIYSKEWKDYGNLIRAIEGGKELEKNKLAEKKLKGQRDIIYDGPKWRVIVPKTHEASCTYGSGTKWCTTTRGDARMFKDYTEKGDLFYLIDKKSTKSLENVMYKIAIFWRLKYSKFSKTFQALPIDSIEMYDAKDRQVNLEHVLPLLPKDLMESVKKYYKNTIDSLNKEIEDEEKSLEKYFLDQQLKLIEEGVVRDLMNKLEKELPKEQVIKLNSGISEMYFNPDSQYFYFVLNDYTGKKEIEGEQPIFSGFLFGQQERTDYEQILKLDLHDEKGTPIDGEEILFDEEGLLFLHGIVFNFFGHDTSSDEYRKNLKRYVKKSNFGINKEEVVNKLYNKIVSFVASNSWRRQWSDKEEESWYDKGEKTFWVPSNSSSTFVFKYPPKKNTLIDNFINYIKKYPGATAKEFYKQYYNFDYYPGYNTQFWGSIKDSGIVKTKKGTYGTLKYYLGPNYKKWTEGKLERYRGQSRPSRWKK